MHYGYWLLIIFLLILLIIGALTYISNAPPSTFQALERFKIWYAFISKIDDFTPCNNYIDIPLYYINLARSKDRKKNMQNQIKKYNIKDAKRIEGVDGQNDLSINYINRFEYLTSSEIGCTLSHLRAIDTAYQNKLEYVLIVEDDVSFALSKFWNRKLSEYINDINKKYPDWNIIKVCGNVRTNEEYTKLNDRSVSMAAYIMNRRAMGEFLKKTTVDDTFILSSANAYSGVADCYIEECCRNIVLINPYLIFPDNRSLVSTIHADHCGLHYLTALHIIEPYIGKMLQHYLEHPDPKIIDHLLDPKVVIDKQERVTDIDIVVNYYATDLSWLFDILKGMKRRSYRLFIYNKSGKKLKVDEKYVHKIIMLNNLGKCDSSHVYHILTVKNKSERTFFLKDNTLNYITIDRLLQLNAEIEPDGPIKVQCPHKEFPHDIGNMTWENYKSQDDPFMTAPSFIRPLGKWCKVVLQQEEFPDLKKVLISGVILCNSSKISKDKKMWYRILLTLCYGSNIETGHYLERLWYHLVNC